MNDQIMSAVNDFVVMILTGILTLLAGLVLALAKKGFSLINAKIESIGSDNARKALLSATSNLETIVSTTVISLQQTLGDDIRESIKLGNGQFTIEDLHGLKDQALETVKSQLTESTKQILASAYTDLDVLISDMIETKVREVKSDLTATSKVLLG